MEPAACCRQQHHRTKAQTASLRYRRRLQSCGAASAGDPVGVLLLPCLGSQEGLQEALVKCSQTRRCHAERAAVLGQSGRVVASG